MKNNYDFSSDSYFYINQCYDRIFTPKHIMPEIHSHYGFEIMYIINGNCYVEFYEGDSKTIVQRYNLFPGDMIFLESRKFHRLFVTDTGARIVNVQVSSADTPQWVLQRNFGSLTAGEPVLDNFFKSDPGTFHVYDSDRVLDTLLLLVNKYLTQTEKTFSLDSLLYVLLVDVANLYIKNLKTYRGYSYIRKAVFEIENNIIDITPEKLVEKSGISRVYLQKLFKTCFDKGIASYIADYKIERACHRFCLMPNIKISEVSEELGFSSLLQFERSFRRAMNKTPSEYRNEIKDSSHLWIETRLPGITRLPL